jgi:phosphohistidine phosphatase
MKKTLILVRHAKSSWSKPGLADIDRPLNERGMRDAPFMAKRMAEAGQPVDHLVSSPANRALTTAKCYAEALNLRDSLTIDPRVYEAGVAQLMNVINGFDDAWNCVLMFGHNPGFSYLIQYLCGQMLHMPTNGVSVLEADLASWENLGTNAATLVEFDYPKKHLPAL